MPSLDVYAALAEQGIQFGMKVIAALLIYLVGFYAIKYIKKLLTTMFTRRGTERTLASFVISAVTIGLFILLIITTVSTLGVNTASLAALLTGGSMAIGLTLQGTVQNFAGGLMLLLFRPFQVGHFIEAMGVSGTVQEMNIVSTKVLTKDNRVIILPNGALANSTINNQFAQPLRRVDLKVSVAYGADAARFRETVLGLLRDDPRILNHTHKTPKTAHRAGVNQSGKEVPDPFVGLNSLNESDITFLVLVWVKAEDYWPVYFDYTERFYTELPKHGFSFAYPHMDVTMTKK